MAKYRPISMDIWEDDLFLSYNMAQQAIFFYLSTNRSCSTSGIYKISLQLTSQMFRQKPKGNPITPDQFLEVLLTLEPNIYFDKEKSLVFNKNHYKNNGRLYGNKKMILKSLISDMQKYDTYLWHLFCKSYPYFEETYRKVCEEIGRVYENNIIIQSPEEPNKDDPPKPKIEIEQTWKDSFEIYLEITKKAYEELLADKAELEKQSKFYYNTDIAMSIEKAYTNFWGKKQGWEFCKKKRRGKTIDQRTTLINAISFNKVPLQASETEETPRYHR